MFRGIQADQMAFHMLNSAQSGLLSPRDAKLAQTMHTAFVRLYFSKGIVALTVVYGKRFHIVIFMSVILQ